MQKRPVWAVILLSGITLGIYTIFWLYNTRKEMTARGIAVPRLRVLFSPLIGVAVLALIAGIYSVIYPVEFASQELIASNNTGAMLLDILTLVVIAGTAIALIVVPLIWFYKYCVAAYQVTRGGTSVSTSYLLFVVLNFIGVGFIWPGIIQDGFNKVGQAQR